MSIFISNLLWNTNFWNIENDITYIHRYGSCTCIMVLEGRWTNSNRHCFFRIGKKKNPHKKIFFKSKMDNKIPLYVNVNNILFIILCSMVKSSAWNSNYLSDFKKSEYLFTKWILKHILRVFEQFISSFRRVSSS